MRILRARTARPPEIARDSWSNYLEVSVAASQTLIASTGAGEVLLEPRPSVFPGVIGSARRNAEYFRDLIHRQTPKIAELDELCGLSVALGQTLQGLVQFKQILGAVRFRDGNVLQRHTIDVAASLLALLPPRLLDQNPPHRFGGSGEEVAAGVEGARSQGPGARGRVCLGWLLAPGSRALIPYQSQIRLVHQRRGLERLSRLLVRQLRGGQLPQFVIDERQELLGGLRIAGVDLREDACHVAHRRQHRLW